MVSVALIGGDGSGKSTIAKMLVEKFPEPIEYIYMGSSLESSNYALPWSRLAVKMKRRNYRKQAEAKGIDDPIFLTTHHMEHRQRKSSALRTLLRLTNRSMEVGYRYLISWSFQRRGYNIVYDRYYLFDIKVDHSSDSLDLSQRITNTFYVFMKHIFPSPDLIIFLDASPQVMVERKNEATVEYLTAWRQTWVQQGSTFSNFVRIDADPPIEEVYANVENMIIKYGSSQ